MNITEALEKLDSYQAQIIHGGTPFGDIADAVRSLQATLETTRELHQCEVNNIKNLMHYADGKPGHVPLSGHALEVRDAIVEKTTRLQRLANAADVMWEEHKKYSEHIHGYEGCDLLGNDSEGHERMQAIVDETLAALKEENAKGEARADNATPNQNQTL